MGEHDEAAEGGHEELYLVLEGAARFTLDGETVVVGPGGLVAVPERSVTRHAVALEDGTTVLAVGGRPAR